MNNRTIKISNIPPEASQEEIQYLLRTFGRVADLKVPLHEVTKTPLGIAFAVMGSPFSASLLVKRLNGTEWNGRMLRVSLSSEPFLSRYRYFMPQRSRGRGRKMPGGVLA